MNGEKYSKNYHYSSSVGKTAKNSEPILKPINHSWLFPPKRQCWLVKISKKWSCWYLKVTTFFHECQWVKLWHSIEIPGKARKYYHFSNIRLVKGKIQPFIRKWTHNHSWLASMSVMTCVLSNLLPVTGVSKWLLKYDSMLILLYFLHFLCLNIYVNKIFFIFPTFIKS